MRLLMFNYSLLLVVVDFLILIVYVATSNTSESRYQDNILSAFTYSLDSDYPIGQQMFGGIAAIDFDRDGNIVIFQRDDHIWTDNTFDSYNIYTKSKHKPIKQETVVTIDPKEKKVTKAWGKNTFFMPHGLSLSSDYNYVWLTDVAMHQVFKYPIDGPAENDGPTLEIGVPFQPGSDEIHFCKPTSVADTGDFVFVADGYCNSRIVMYSRKGEYLGQFGQSGNSYSIKPRLPTFQIPHKIVWAAEFQKLLVADRENGRIQLFNFKPKLAQEPGSELEPGYLLKGAITSTFPITDPKFHGRLFSIDYSPYMGGLLVAVSGQSPTSKDYRPRGFVYNLTTSELISEFTPNLGKEFGMAHDIAVSPNNAESIFIVDTVPPNLWKFSRPAYLDKPVISQLTQPLQAEKSSHDGYDRKHLVIYPVFMLMILLIVFGLAKKARSSPYNLSSNSLASLYNSNYPSRFNARPKTSPGRFLSTLFSRRPYFGIDQGIQQSQNEFSRVPLNELTDDDKSDSDVEEFNINQARASINISV